MLFISVSFTLTLFIVMRQITRANSLYVKTYFEINWILICFHKLSHLLKIFFKAGSETVLHTKGRINGFTAARTTFPMGK